MGMISFKSVGKTVDILRKESSVSGSISPIGFKTPLNFGNSSEGVFAMHMSLADQLHDNLRNLILTNWGERVALYDFGANLRELVTEFTTSENFDTDAISRIATAISKWMPFVQPQDFVSFTDKENNKNTAIIRIRITYDIPLLNIAGKSLEVTLYAIG